MLIQVLRDNSNDKATLSCILIDGKIECFGLEDEFREVKVKGETRIPAGRYALKIRKEGGFHTKYKEKFAFHRGMIHVQNVPGFEYVLIHVGNFEKDTNGCLLLGLTRDPKAMTIGMSVHAYEDFYKKVVSEVEKGSAFIEYVDIDRAIKSQQIMH